MQLQEFWHKKMQNNAKHIHTAADHWQNGFSHDRVVNEDLMDLLLIALGGSRFQRPSYRGSLLEGVC